MRSLYLSPSTQERNKGVGNYGTEEHRCNQIADIVENILNEHGVKVHRNNIDQSLGSITRESNKLNVDIHLAIHTNAYNKKVRGCEVYCHKKGGYSEQLAKSVYTQLSDITPTKDRGVKEGQNFYGPGKHMYEPANTNSTSILIEVAFHDQKDDAEWIIKNIEKISIAIASGVLNYLKIDYKIKESDILYRIMVGSYSKIENAKNHITRLKSKNIDACIMPYEKA